MPFFTICMHIDVHAGKKKPVLEPLPKLRTSSGFYWFGFLIFHNDSVDDDDVCYVLFCFYFVLFCFILLVILFCFCYFVILFYFCFILFILFILFYFVCLVWEQPKPVLEHLPGPTKSLHYQKRASASKILKLVFPTKTQKPVLFKFYSSFI